MLSRSIFRVEVVRDLKTGTSFKNLAITSGSQLNIFLMTMSLGSNHTFTYITNDLGGVIYVTDLSRDGKDSIRCLFLVNDIQNNLVTLTIDNHYTKRSK
jgi:hypothetical protein